MVEEIGADALRFALVNGSAPGSDMRLTQAKLDGGRNFTNKLWNAARFVLANRPEAGAAVGTTAPTLAVRWIGSRLSDATARATRQLDTLDLGAYAATVYEAAWSDYCDWFLEMAKVDLRRDDASAEERGTTWAAAADGLATLLRLLHPLMPFVTEEIWRALRDVAPDAAGEPLLIAARWPRPGEGDEAAEAAFADLAALVRGVRNLRTEASSPASAWIPLMVEPAGSAAADTIRSEERYLETLARVRPIGFATAGDARPAGVTSGRLGVAWLGEVASPEAGSGEDRRAAQVDELDRHIARLRALLADAAFTSRAPAAVVERERTRLADLEEQRQRLVGEG
jgi:valyl-tRNA synthetase